MSGSVAKWQGVGLVTLRQPKTRGFKSRPGLYFPFSYPFRLDYFFPAVRSSNSERIYWKIHRHCQYDFEGFLRLKIVCSNTPETGNAEESRSLELWRETKISSSLISRNGSYHRKSQWTFDQGKSNLVQVRGEFELSDNVLELVPVFYRVVVGNVSDQCGEN